MEKAGDKGSVFVVLEGIEWVLNAYLELIYLPLSIELKLLFPLILNLLGQKNLSGFYHLLLPIC